MLSSHEQCPICGRNFIHGKYLNKYCPVVEQIICYVESIYNHITQMTNIEYPVHTYFQVSSLYGEMLYQKVHFPFKDMEVEVNYTKKLNTITYFSKSDIHSTQISMPPDKIEIKRILELDFPHLTKILNKAKTLVLFLWIALFVS